MSLLAWQGQGLSPVQWGLVGLLAASWVWTGIRTGWMAKQRGRRQWLWTLITVFCSGLVAVIVFWWDDSQEVDASDLPGVQRRQKRRDELDELDKDRLE
jgi:hypothetical protein